MQPGRCKLNIRKHFSMGRLGQHWNRLCREVLEPPLLGFGVWGTAGLDNPKGLSQSKQSYGIRYCLAEMWNTSCSFLSCSEGYLGSVIWPERCLQVFCFVLFFWKGTRRASFNIIKKEGKKHPSGLLSTTTHCYLVSLKWNAFKLKHRVKYMEPYCFLLPFCAYSACHFAFFPWQKCDAARSRDVLKSICSQRLLWSSTREALLIYPLHSE